MIKERILLVEDNKSLSKLIAKKMEEKLDVEVLQAYSQKEAEDFLEENDDFFIALLDLNLPDAPNGEIVDFILSKGIPSIVLTGNIDENTRETMLQKGVIDYVFKTSMEDINYIFSLIKRVMKNRDIRVMVVDDSSVVRKNIKNILSKFMFKVNVAAHGEEALIYLDDYKDIKLILVDYNMPVIDGLEFTKLVREKYDRNKIGIISMTSSDERFISAKFLKMGANDFLHKPFDEEELICRINNTLENIENINALSKMANYDFLTGVYNRRYFFQKIKEFFKGKNNFALAMIDIDYFKKINDTYGHDVGDIVLKKIAQILKDNTKGSDIVSRFGGEEFCIALKNVSNEAAVRFFSKLRSAIAKEKVVINDKKISFTASIGVSFRDDKDNIEDILKEADEALYRAKNGGRNRVEIC